MIGIWKDDTTLICLTCGWGKIGLAAGYCGGYDCGPMPDAICIFDKKGPGADDEPPDPAPQGE